MKTIHEKGTSDGWHGIIELGGQFPPESDRYHMYIGLFCPFAHRGNLVRHLKGLSSVISLSVVKPYPRGDENGWPGWQFAESNDEYPGATVDHLFGSKYLHEVYFKADPEYKGKYSVPIIWDKKLNTIVSNESAEILRWLPNAFDSIELPSKQESIPGSFYPEDVRSQIDSCTEWIQSDLNGGVYKAGFAKDQEEYDKNVPVVFGALNRLEEIVAHNGGPFMLGSRFTELDIRVYATVIRFDSIYVQHFKCNLGMIRREYPVLHNWLRNLYWNVPGFKESTDFKHIKENYTKSHDKINPLRITPMGPWPDIEGREGVETDFGRLKPGGLKMPLVLDHMPSTV